MGPNNFCYVTRHFLPLLGTLFSSAMSAELMKSKFVRRPSVRPSVCGIDYL